MEHKVNTTIQTRYFTFGNPQSENLIIALHGYGQLASYFIEKFSFLNSEDFFVVAPEGLHRFYVNGTSGRVGASWMTKENRETDINNYIHYLDVVVSEISTDTNFKRKIILGFSQGGATAARYLESTRFKFDALILWAAVFPPDLLLTSINKTNFQKNYFVLGSSDQYYSENDFVIEQEKLSKIGIKFDLISFEGKHEIHPKTLEKLLNEI